METLDRLIQAYEQAPDVYQAGRYWKAYEHKIANEIKNADIAQLRSGKYPVFGAFGFSESIYHYRPDVPLHEKLVKKFIRNLFITNRALMPYSLKLSDIREMAYHHCMLQGKLAGIKSIAEIETSTFGHPSDLFSINGKQYSMQFLNYYVRFCFAQKILRLKGNETIVELGSGSGFQVEILKKIFPGLTILCFDLPAPLYLCQEYLSKVLGEQQVVKAGQTLEASRLEEVLQKGKVHFFGNWKFPLLENFTFDLFWNAASFGEMEPHIVENYLRFVKPNCQAIYLLQARKGKESFKDRGVVTPITFEDYNALLSGFRLIEESDALEAHRRMTQSGGYFQAVWQKAPQP